MKNILYLVLFTFSFSSAQNYVALDTTDYKKRKVLIERIDLQQEETNNGFKKKYKKNIRKEITFSYDNLFNNLKKDVEKKKLVFNPIFSDYIDSITNTIIKNNATLIDNNLKMYIMKHNSPNAFSIGNGYVFLNMGLFKYLENEDQLVSILTHEIAHQVLEHSEKNILHNAKQETSKEKKEEANRIRKKEFNKQSEAFSIFKNILFANKKRHRAQEIEADSLGFLLFKNTKYAPKEFINALGILLELDSLPSITLPKTIYKKYFDLPKQPFNDEWLMMEDFTNYNYNHFDHKIDTDSIKTHPEVIERIRRLEKKFSSELLVDTKKIDNSKFKELQKIARLEDVANLNYKEKYGLSIYLTLFRLQKNTEINYYKYWLGTNFNNLYEAKKKYQFNRHVDKIIPDEQDESYQQFLSFLWNLRLNEIKNIADFYLNKKAED